MHALLFLPAVAGCDMIFNESKINLFKALSIIVIRLGTHYYKCLSPETKHVQFKIHYCAIQPCHYKRPSGPATDKCTQSLKYSVTDNNMTNFRRIHLIKVFYCMIILIVLVSCCMNTTIKIFCTYENSIVVLEPWTFYITLNIAIKFKHG